MTSRGDKTKKAVLIALVIVSIFLLNAKAERVHLKFTSQVAGPANRSAVGIVIVSLISPSGLTPADLDVYAALGLGGRDVLACRDRWALSRRSPREVPYGTECCFETG